MTGKMIALMTLKPVPGRKEVPRGQEFAPVSAQERLDLLQAGRARDADQKPAKA